MQAESKFETEPQRTDCADIRLALWARLLRAVKCESADDKSRARRSGG